MIAIWANVSTNRREWLTTEFTSVVNFLFSEVFCFMTPELMLEIFGYIGTVLVLLSFFMTDMKWMRIINMVGGLITLIYAILRHDNPVMVLNASIITINTIQLIRYFIKVKKEKKAVISEEPGAYNNEKKKEENI
jgi:lipid-A-disaccharide synthase-like uncharacterized protein